VSSIPRAHELLYRIPVLAVYTQGSEEVLVLFFGPTASLLHHKLSLRTKFHPLNHWLLAFIWLLQLLGRVGLIVGIVAYSAVRLLWHVHD